MRYRIADVTVEVRCPRGVARSDVESRYGAFSVPNGALDLSIDVTADAAFENDRAPARPYPGVDARREGDGYRLDRRDVSVVLDVSGTPARALGRVADRVSALDTVLRACLSVLLPRRRGLLLHASGVADAGRAFLFSGPSGAGKSTAALLTGAPVVLSDDIVAVTLDGGRAIAHAVPFGGLSAPPSRPLALPIEVLCLLEQSDAHRLEPLPPAAVLGRFISNVLYLPTGDPRTKDLLEVCEGVVRAIPARRLRFRRDGGFWEGLRHIGGAPIEGPVSLDHPPGGYYDGGSG